MKRALYLLGLLVLLCGQHASSAQAAATPAPEKGLLITPLRQYPSVNAGSSAHSTFSIANLTGQPLTVALSVQEFSVTNYTYNYTFNQPSNDWLHLSVSSVTLQPNQSSDIAYSIVVPAGSSPGGRYYTLFASANLSTQGVRNTIQATDLLYVTVNGALTRVSHLQSSSIHWIAFGHNIPYTLEPVSTGNVYSFVYVSGELHGLFVRPPQTSTAHLLIPGKVRTLSATIPSPILPGIYRAVYGYKTADANWIIQQSHWVIFIPPWFIAVLLAALLLAGRFWPARKRSLNADRITQREPE